MSETKKINLVLNHLIEKLHINPLQAWQQYGCYRLSAVIFELRKRGWLIETEIVESSSPLGLSRHALYVLHAEANTAQIKRHKEIKNGK